MEDTSGSITRQLLPGLLEGDPAAQTELYTRYAEQMAVRARGLLRGLPPVCGGTDVVQLAMTDLLAGLAKGRFDKLEDRQDLEKLLYTIVLRKALNEKKKWLAQRRNPIRVVSDADLVRSGQLSEEEQKIAELLIVEGLSADAIAERAGLPVAIAEERCQEISDWVKSKRRQPAHVLTDSQSGCCTHECSVLEQLLGTVPDPFLTLMLAEAIEDLDTRDRHVITMYVLGGYTHKEIAEILGMTRVMVTRRVQYVF